MTVSSTLNKHVYVGNSATTVFPFTFRVLSASDLHIYLTNTTTGVTTELTTNFTISPSGGSYPADSGNVTYPNTGTILSSTQKLTILRELRAIQETVYPNNSALKPKVVETSLDRITMIAQQLLESDSRTLKGDIASSASYTLPAPSSNAMLGWNSGATAIENKSAASNVFAVSDVQGAIDHKNLTHDLNYILTNGNTTTKVINEALGANIASASTINLTTATGNFLHITGTTAITAVTLGSGMRRDVIFDGVLTLTHHATDNNLPGGENITTAAGDRASYRSDGTKVYCMEYVKASATTVGAGVQGSYKNLKITNNAVVSFTGNTTNLSTSITSVSSTAGLVAGMFIYGSGISTGTTISAVGSGTITLSSNASITASGVALTAGYCNTRADITADQVVLFNASNSAYLATDVSLTASTVTSGADGLDTGTKANNTFYAVWVIAKGDGTKASLLSLSSTSPTMPTGYTYKAVVGHIRTDSSGNLMRILQLDNRAQYKITANSNTANMPLIISGVQGSISVPTYVAGSISSFVPSTASKISVTLFSPASGGAMAAPNNNYGAFGSATNPPPLSVLPGSSNATSTADSWVIESTNVYFASTLTAGGLFCKGWEDNL